MKLNREQRRKYVKMIRHDSYASVCPKCHQRSRFIAFENGSADKCDVYCELCEKPVAQNIAGLTPRTYVKIKMEEKE